VSFAALLDESAARAQAAKINVNGRGARVVAGIVSGTTVYRIVLGCSLTAPRPRPQPRPGDAHR